MTPSLPTQHRLQVIAGTRQHKLGGNFSPRSARGNHSGYVPTYGDGSTGMLSMGGISAVSRASSSLAAYSYLDDGAYFERRANWNMSHPHIDADGYGKQDPHGSAWHRYSRQDSLNMNLERHPVWVTKAPGTYDSTAERWNLPHEYKAARQPFACRPSTTWDSRHTVAHVLDRNPVVNGNRRLSPARRRHNGGTGAD